MFNKLFGYTEKQPETKEVATHTYKSMASPVLRTPMFEPLPVLERMPSLLQFNHEMDLQAIRARMRDRLLTEGITTAWSARMNFFGGTDPFEIAPTPQTIELPEELRGKSEQEIIRAIHNEFYTEVDRILENANISPMIKPEDEQFFANESRRMKLGFQLTDPRRYEELRRREIAGQENYHLRNAIMYFKAKYPLYKFITQDGIQRICDKYALVYGESSWYRGDIPEKNLIEMERAVGVIAEDDKADGKHLWATVLKSPLMIAAPAKDFDLTGKKVQGYKVMEIPIPDPVAIQPVRFEVEDRVYLEAGLILSAWGDEASDPLVLNPIHQ